MAEKKRKVGTKAKVTTTVAINEGGDKKVNAVHAAVTNQIITMLDSGELPPWSPGWNRSLAMPRSFITGRPYQGWNQLSFLMDMISNGYDNPFYIAQGAARAAGIFVPFDKMVWGNSYIVKSEVNEDTGEDEIKYARLKGFRAINVEAIDEENRPETSSDWENLVFPNGVKDNKRADHIIDAFFDKKNHKNAPATSGTTNRAWYNPAEHTVGLFKKVRGISTTGYYGTAFHEMIHATGHSSMLGRFGLKNDVPHHANHEYSFEELVAEMGSMMLLAYLGMSDDRNAENSAAYIAGWSKSLKEEGHVNWLISASNKAKKAVEYILNVAGVTFAEYTSEQKEQVEEIVPPYQKKTTKTGTKVPKQKVAKKKVKKVTEE